MTYLLSRKKTKAPNEALLTPQTQPKAVLLVGALGSGKTQFLNNILPYVSTPFQLIINDVGSVNIDATRFGDTPVESLQSGCICCDDLENFISVIEKYKNSSQTLFIEPSGIAGGFQLYAVLRKAGYQIKVVNLIDVKHFEERSPEEKVIMETQTRIADIIGLTWLGENEKSVLEWVEKFGKKDVYHIPNSQKEHISQSNIYQELVQEILNFGNSHSYILPHQKQTQNPLFTQNYYPENSFSLEQLQALLFKEKSLIIRAKGVIEGIEFDFVHGDISFQGKTNKPNVLTLISHSPVNIELNENLAFSPQDLSHNTPKFMPLSQQQSSKKISDLIQDYFTYMKYESEIQKLNEFLKTSPDHESLSKSIGELMSLQKKLGENMKFETPYIWLEYKLQAYKGTPRAIITIQDLKKHCESPTYICHKRLKFLTNILKNQFNIDIFEERFEQKNIYDVIPQEVLKQISQNQEWMQKRTEYEFFQRGEEVAKWENFVA